LKTTNTFVADVHIFLLGWEIVVVDVAVIAQ
jgi:hypothetical protein